MFSLLQVTTKRERD